MADWHRRLKVNPIPTLLASGDDVLLYFVRRDLLEEPVGPVEALWEAPNVLKIVKKQQENGSWRYPGKSKDDSWTNHALLETFRQLRVLARCTASTATTR
jgi:hypothetical protein